MLTDWNARSTAPSRLGRSTDTVRRGLLAAVFVLTCTSAFALPTSVQKGLKLGAGCVGPVSMLAPKLGMCAVASTKARIWCPNGDIFDLDDEKAPLPLVRSLCNLTQVP